MSKGSSPVGAARYQEMMATLTEILKDTTGLKDFEVRFVRDTAQDLLRYRDKKMFSIKQWTCYNEIVSRYSLIRSLKEKTT